MNKRIGSQIFDYHLNCTIAEIKATLEGKQGEYAADNDRMHNFNKAAEIAETTPERALYGMMAKHLVSVIDIVDDIDKGVYPKTALTEEKFGDLINYLILLKIMIVDKLPIMEE